MTDQLDNASASTSAPPSDPPATGSDVPSGSHPGQGSGGPIYRHYRGASRQNAEDAYRFDAAQALAAGWVPVGHRWTEDWSGVVLTVAYAPESADAPPASSAQAFGPDQVTGVAGEPTQVTDRHAAPAVQPPASEIPPQPAGRRLSVQTLDLHCAGEPLRLIRAGLPELPFAPILERRAWLRDHADHIRRAIVHEPRGHRDMYAAALMAPYSSQADAAVLFMHNEGYSTMCGHGVIAITVGLLEEGLYPVEEPVTTIRYEVPAGLVIAQATVGRDRAGQARVEEVRFVNVPAYLHERSLAIRPDGLQLAGLAAQNGRLDVDLAFGGAYYGIVDAADLGLRVVPEQADRLRRAGSAITDVLRRDHTPTHPTDTELGFIYGTIIVDHAPANSPDGRATGATMRNVTIFADAELDRSPCGSGTSAILAQLHGRGRLQVGQEIINASITGEAFKGRIEADALLGQHPAVVTSIAGTAYVVGYSTLVVDERDPLGDGFLLG